MSLAHIYNREQLVQLVKDVLGEVQEINTTRSYSVNFYGEHRAIAVTFLCGNTIVGEYIMALPPEVIAFMEDETRNPYGILAATFRTSRESMAPELVKAPSSSEGT